MSQVLKLFFSFKRSSEGEADLLESLVIEEDMDSTDVFDGEGFEHNTKDDEMDAAASIRL